MQKQPKAALFDLDGVILDTESQYSVFWGGIGHEYHPEVPNFCQLIKGQTLVQIYERWFAGEEAKQAQITQRLDAFEAQMHYEYIPGAREYIMQLHALGIPMSIVTSSNQEKMRQVMSAHPELPQLFDRILTSEDFSASKPAPDCYLLGMRLFGVPAADCAVFEDSINGLKAGRAAGCHVVGLATTNPREVIAPLADEVIDNFKEILV